MCVSRDRSPRRLPLRWDGRGTRARVGRELWVGGAHARKGRNIGALTHTCAYVRNGAAGIRTPVPEQSARRLYARVWWFDLDQRGRRQQRSR